MLFNNGMNLTAATLRSTAAGYAQPALMLSPGNHSFWAPLKSNNYDK
jgi:hypothetical protein